jgi:Protein of unknown function (DUF3592)
VNPRIIIFFGSSIFLGIGIFMLSRATTDATRWPTAEGKITDVSITGSRALRRSTHGYQLIVRYEYDVGGGHFEGNRFSVLDQHAAKSLSRQYLEDLKGTTFPMGGKILVHYDPTNPKRAVLNSARATWSDMIGCIMMLGFGCVGMLGAFFGKVGPPRIAVRIGGATRQ